MLQFRKLTENRYISASKFSLVKYQDSYQILLNGKLPEWGCKFTSVKAAEKFINSHDYIHASTTRLSMSPDDIEFIIDSFGFENKGFNKWIKNTNDSLLTLSVDPQGDAISLVEKKGKASSRKTFNNPLKVIDFLDSIDASTYMSNGKPVEGIGELILAAKSIRDITSNLVRVKSSNVWAYGIDIKDRKSTSGTVFIQFKGKNGGPGDVYAYYDVPVKIWRQLVGAPSKGHAFWVLIRNNFLYRKLTGDRRGKLRNAVN